MGKCNLVPIEKAMNRSHPQNDPDLGISRQKLKQCYGLNRTCCWKIHPTCLHSDVLMLMADGLRVEDLILQNLRDSLGHALRRWFFRVLTVWIQVWPSCALPLSLSPFLSLTLSLLHPPLPSSWITMWSILHIHHYQLPAETGLWGHLILNC